MGKRKGGLRRRSRALFRKNVRSRGKFSLSRYFASFNPGDRVVLCGEPSIQKGLYHSRFHGKQGIVSAKRGRCYEILVQDGQKQKLLILHPVHLKKVE